MLRDSIVLAVEYFEIYMVSAVFLKSVAYYFPCIAAVVVYQSFYIFKNKDFGLTLFYYSGKFTKKCTSCVFKSFTLSYH